MPEHVTPSNQHKHARVRTSRHAWTDDGDANLLLNSTTQVLKLKADDEERRLELEQKCVEMQERIDAKRKELAKKDAKRKAHASKVAAAKAKVKAKAKAKAKAAEEKDEHVDDEHDKEKGENKENGEADEADEADEEVALLAEPKAESKSKSSTTSTSTLVRRGVDFDKGAKGSKTSKSKSKSKIKTKTSFSFNKLDNAAAGSKDVDEPLKVGDHDGSAVALALARW